MSNVFNTKYIWSEEVAILSSELFYKYEFRHSYRRYMGWAFIAMAQFGVVGALKHDAYGMLILSSFLLVYWYGIRWQLRKRLAQRLFHASPLANQEVLTSFDAQGMKTDDVLTPWQEIQKVVEVANGFLFYGKSQSNFFPKNAFSSSEDRDALRRFIVNANIINEKES